MTAVVASVDRDRWIAKLAPGRSFADVGGLWNTVNEKVSVAAAAGASSLAMIDIQPMDNVWWRKFDDRMIELGVSGVQKIHADATLAAFPDVAGVFDVIFCSGILYHLPSPFELLYNLRRACRDHLILTSMTVPERIENEEGAIDLSGGRAIYLPAIGERERRVLRAHFGALGLKPENVEANVINVAQNDLIKPNGRPNFGPWWFLMPPSFIAGMARSAGFDVVEYGDAWSGRSSAFVLKAR